MSDCKNGKDFVGYATKHGGQVDHQTGSHAIVKGPSGGICPVPMHNKDLPNGTRHSICKTLVAIGIIGLSLMCIANQLISGVK